MMNINLLQLLSKYIIFLTVSVMSSLGIGNYSENEAVVNNIIKKSLKMLQMLFQREK